jgi:hypothetical protein
MRRVFVSGGTRVPGPAAPRTIGQQGARGHRFDAAPVGPENTAEVHDRYWRRSRCRELRQPRGGHTTYVHMIGGRPPFGRQGARVSRDRPGGLRSIAQRRARGRSRAFRLHQRRPSGPYDARVLEVGGPAKRGWAKVASLDRPSSVVCPRTRSLVALRDPARVPPDGADSFHARLGRPPGLVTRSQMIAALLWAVENPPASSRIVDVPEIRRIGGRPVS